MLNIIPPGPPKLNPLNPPCPPKNAWNISLGSISVQTIEKRYVNTLSMTNDVARGKGGGGRGEGFHETKRKHHNWKLFSQIIVWKVGTQWNHYSLPQLKKIINRQITFGEWKEVLFESTDTTLNALDPRTQAANLPDIIMPSSRSWPESYLAFFLGSDSTL